MAKDQGSIESNTTAFRDIRETDLILELRNTRLIGFGENPHWVKEYYPIVRDVVRDLLAQRRRVLVLLEHEYWMNQALDDFIHGRNDVIMDYSFRDPELGILYGSALHQFYLDLRSLCGTYPERLSCRHIDFFMTPKNEARTQLVKTIDKAKWETSRTIKRYQKENDLRKFAETREQFLTKEAIEGYHAFEPDATVLLAGSFHAGKKGGRPLDECYVKSVMARLAESINGKPISIRFAAIHGKFAKLEYRDKQLAKIAANCDDWGQEDIQIEFRESIRKLPGEAFITNISGLTVREELSTQYKDWTENFDYLMTLRQVTPDIPMNR